LCFFALPQVGLSSEFVKRTKVESWICVKFLFEKLNSSAISAPPVAVFALANTIAAIFNTSLKEKCTLWLDQRVTPTHHV